MPDNTHLNLNDKVITLKDMKLHAKNQIYTSNSLKILQSDWPRAFLYLTREPDFSQTCGFNRITKVIKVQNLHINVLFFLAKSKKNNFGRDFGH